MCTRKFYKVKFFEIFDLIYSDLKGLYEDIEARQIVKMLFSEVLDMKAHELFLNKNLEVTKEQQEELSRKVDLLLQAKPIQYVIGKSEFLDWEFFVNENVLIPRPETEELVLWVDSEITNHERILDIGTGSGVIPISLKLLNGKRKVFALDISEKSLAVAQKNSKTLEAEVEFFQHDILSERELFQNKFDIVVSNPPYVLESEKLEMHANVLEHEPHIALFVSDKDPIIFYRKISELAQNILVPDGKIYFEINPKFAVQIQTLLENLGFVEIRSKKDFSGKIRFISAKK